MIEEDAVPTSDITEPLWHSAINKEHLCLISSETEFQDVMQQPGAHHSTICIDEWRAHLNLHDLGYIHQT
uniref:Uncharacterized protein n=1 Tax=Romanomermis culicivorax TaxID=13658 RepID=A0A915K7A3_ROMCU